MIKYYFLCLSLLLIATIGQGQQGFRGVVGLGINAAQIDGDQLTGFNQAGLVLGFGAIFDINEHWSLGPEFYYSQKGSRTTAKQEETIPAIRFRTNYADIPVLVHYHTGVGGLTVSAGPSFNGLLNGKLRVGNLENQDISSRWRQVDFGFVAGFEYTFFDRISGAVRYFYSVLPANSGDLSEYNANQVIFQKAGLRNNVLTFMLRYDLVGRVKEKEIPVSE